MIPNEIRDIHSYIDSIPYGDVVFVVKRVNRKTVAIESEAGETLRYREEDNTDPRLDLNNILDNLTATRYSGEVSIKLTYKDGAVSLITIYDKKTTKY